ncbi:transcriptional activator NhaR [Endozoicomonas sp. SM1973]|uniref:Transcriptional activator NhaR n=1 Tax=Spartinivicinus marinus TaxID=2994442 RepID=A0A853IAV6_9GAMM|nr:transcriptional activator NhaR [Spartinivicinus marinus]MCX4029648.1 transcriptional activator NhaR [Spartinivicinus marinus]NYZ66971.1 transcriptional activator NhaR [Spartinivicinus marinus]
MPNTLNYKHLYYFWVIAREGSLASASKTLNLAPQTLSGQLATLEESLGGLLFNRQGRQLTLTYLGKTVLRYADQMFQVAEELKQVSAMVTSRRSIQLSVGICTSIHKLVAYQLLEPALSLDQEVALTCKSGSLDYLMQQLESHHLDVVLGDQLPPAKSDRLMHWYELGQSTISIFAASALAERLRDNFPLSLDKQPILAATFNSPYFQQLMQWLGQQGVKPIIRAEVDDSALIKVFGANGLGAFAAPTVITDEVCRQYQVELVANIDAIQEKLFAITRNRFSSHPAVEAICKQHIEKTE